MTREDKLIKQIIKGNSSCLDELIALYYPDIFRYCLQHTINRQAAEDAVQDTFMKALKYFDRYVHKGKFKAFLYQIAANTCIDMWRKIRPDHLDDTLPYNDSGFEKIDSAMNFHNMIKNLSHEHREIVLLRFSHELKIREIAAVTSLPLRTVQSRLRAALKQIEGKIKEGELNNE